jgi:hypothetical protein
MVRRCSGVDSSSILAGVSARGWGRVWVGVLLGFLRRWRPGQFEAFGGEGKLNRSCHHLRVGQEDAEASGGSAVCSYDGVPLRGCRCACEEEMLD